MKNETLAAQAQLAADILRTGHPWEFSPDRGAGWLKGTHADVIYCLSVKNPIRLALATPGDGRELHNPDGLTAERVGAGWRLLLPEELDGRFSTYGKDSCNWWSKGYAGDARSGTGWAWKVSGGATSKFDTCRVPISVPWPEAPKVDPFKELKEAYKAGKVIQCEQTGPGSGEWMDVPHPMWDEEISRYRIKPWQLPAPPAGKRWHREDWTEEMLPAGYRPLLSGEKIVYGEGGDELLLDCELTQCGDPQRWNWQTNGKFSDKTPDRGFWRTSRPLPVEPVMVKLEEKDVPPGSAFRFKAKVDWVVPLCVGDGAVGFPDTHGNGVLKITFEALMDLAEINRSIPMDSRWSDEAWELCKKPVL